MVVSLPLLHLLKVFKRKAQNSPYSSSSIWKKYSFQSIQNATGSALFNETGCIKLVCIFTHHLITSLSHLFNNLALPIEFEDLVPQQLLPSIVRLFDDTTSITSQLGINITSIQERALALFGYLIFNHTKLQSAAMV